MVTNMNETQVNKMLDNHTSLEDDYRGIMRLLRRCDESDYTDATIEEMQQLEKQISEIEDKLTIIIQDWTGRLLFSGPITDTKIINKVLDTNKCNCDGECDECNGTGYKGDFEVHWQDSTIKANVYEFIDY
jgi:hypothetical protein